MRQLTNIFRRVYRIFAHAWFQHRDVFWDVESKGGLYIFFKTVCDTYNLIQPENYTIPAEAEGIDATPVVSKQSQPVIWSRAAAEKEASSGEKGSPASGKLTPSSGHPTQRHRHSPSMSASSISPLAEVPEEDAEKGSKQPTGLGLTNGDEKVSENPDDEETKVLVGHETEDTAEETPNSPLKPEEIISPGSSETDSLDEPIFTPTSSEEEKEHPTVESTTQDSNKPEEKTESPSIKKEPDTAKSEPGNEITEPLQEAETSPDVKTEEPVDTVVAHTAEEDAESTLSADDVTNSDADVDEPAGETSEEPDTASKDLSTPASTSTSDPLTESQSTLDSTPSVTEHPSKEPEADKPQAVSSETSAVPPKKSAAEDAAEESDLEGVKRSDTAVKTGSTTVQKADDIVASDPKADAKDTEEATKSLGD
jgi:hypothetical protein